jgi:stage II sporulation protein D
MAKQWKKQTVHPLLLVLAVACLILLGLILYARSRTALLLQILSEEQVAAGGGDTSQEETGEPVYTTTLRILLMDDDQDIYRSQVQVCGTGGMQVVTENEIRTFEAQEWFSVAWEEDQDSFAFRILPIDGKLLLADAAGNVSQEYAGSLELWRLEQGITVVNEVDLEDYLKGVVPSEMPSSYGMEALKAQAVCARTYAYSHSGSYAYPAVNAQMDDTTSFQVYNHTGQTPETDQAVEETAGMVLTSDGRLIDALYYSTSCGYEQDGTLFGQDMDKSVLAGGYIGDVAPEDDFESYIRREDPGAYESQERYFRWTAVTDSDKLSDMLYAIRQQMEKEDVVDCNEKTKKVLQSATDGDELGNLSDIQILRRNAGGVAEEMTLVFEKSTVTITGQLPIRDVLGALVPSVSLHNGEEVGTSGRLPSAAIAIEKEDTGNFMLYGGGFGHGVGMSQNGAKNLAELGYNFEEILLFFYKNTNITGIS